ncbi:MAG TPA: aldehyde dehydrogenase family protein [Burkholderiaceae bacterium]|nr:aldehyde dehydrogenase family protein [Burkholderiaceae bacterium]
MSTALPDRLEVPQGHFIGGRLVRTPQRMEVLRPSDAKPYAALDTADAATVDEAVRDAHRAWREADWSTCAPRDRAKVLRRWAELIEADARTLGTMEGVGSTRPVRDAIAGDVPFTAEGIRFFAEYADKIGGDVAATRSDQLGMVMAQPYGVVGAIAPWNFPLSMVSWKAGPALAAGNAVVLKPSEITPFTAIRLAQLALEAGVPPGIFNVVQGDGRTAGAALCAHPLVGKVTFTGSTATGAQIMSACALHGPKPVTLELGGKSPQVVFDDIADVDRTAEVVARAITANAGQVCIAGSRLIAHRRIADALAERIMRKFAQLKPGPTWDDGATLPPIASRVQLSRIDDAVRRAREAGAELLCGGQCWGDEGYYYLPTLLANVDASNPAVREEIFGPVLTLQTFDDEDQAFVLASHESYGLAAGVHTSNAGRAMRAMRRIDAGTVWINRYGRTSDFILPTGGWGGSGFGKDLGRQAVEANLRFKTVLMDFST